MAKLKFKDENNEFIPVVQDVKVNDTSVFDGKDANIELKTINNQDIVGEGNINVESVYKATATISVGSVYFNEEDFQYIKEHSPYMIEIYFEDLNLRRLFTLESKSNFGLRYSSYMFNQLHLSMYVIEINYDETYDVGSAFFSYQYNLENSDNKVTTINSSSTNTQYPSAKCMYDLIGNIEQVLSEV